MSYEFVFTDIPFQRQRAQRIRRLLRISTSIMLAGCGVWLAIATALRLWPMFWVEIAGVGASLVLLWLLRGQASATVRHLCMLLTFGFVLSIIVLEANTPGAAPVLHLYLLCLAVAAFLVFFDSRPVVPWVYVGACIVLFTARQFEWLRLAPILPPDAALQALTRHMTMIAVFLILVALMKVFVADIAEAERQLATANARLEVIVDNMLPESIAARLRAEGHTFADAFVNVTILFADVVGFTELAARQSARQTVSLLDELFSRFDDLVEKLGVEKIKTNGDTYMVAGGVPHPRPDHASAIADLALLMRDEAHLLGLDLRVGINSGPVVAGVIGRKRFIYDLWGDAVNVASRMQSSGAPNTIQITEATRRLLDDAYETQARGAVDVRGRGAMETFLLTGLREIGSS